MRFISVSSTLTYTNIQLEYINYTHTLQRFAQSRIAYAIEVHKYRALSRRTRCAYERVLDFFTAILGVYFCGSDCLVFGRQ